MNYKNIGKTLMYFGLIIFIFSMATTHIENLMWDVDWRIQLDREDAQELVLLELGIDKYEVDENGNPIRQYTLEYDEWFEESGRQLEREVEEHYFLVENLVTLARGIGYQTDIMLYFFASGFILCFWDKYKDE